LQCGRRGRWERKRRGVGARAELTSARPSAAAAGGAVGGRAGCPPSRPREQRGGEGGFKVL